MVAMISLNDQNEGENCNFLMYIFNASLSETVYHSMAGPVAFPGFALGGAGLLVRLASKRSSYTLMHARIALLAAI